MAARKELSGLEVAGPLTVDGSAVVTMAMIENYANPVGSVSLFPKDVAPSNYLLADGTTTHSISAYPLLWALYGTTFGGNGTTTFGVPDVEGYYPRFAGGIDVGRAAGTIQGDQNKIHDHAGSTADSAGSHSHIYSRSVLGANSQSGSSTSGYSWSSVSTGVAGAHTHNLTITSDGGSEVRVKSYAFMPYIRAS